MESKENQAILLVILAGFFWGTQGVFVRWLSGYQFDSTTLAAVRITGTAVFAFGYLLFFRRAWLRIQKKDLLLFLASGIFSIIGFNVMYYASISHISISVAAVLLYTSPSIVSVLSCLIFKEKFTKNKLLALCCAFIGCFFVSGITSGIGSVSTTGILLGLGSACAYAMYSIFSRLGIEKGYHPLTVMTYTFLTAAAAMILLNQGKFLTMTVQNPGAAPLELAFVLFSSIVPYTLYTIGLSRLETSKASILSSTEAVAAACYGILLFHEPYSFSIFLGIAGILASIVVLNLKKL